MDEEHFYNYKAITHGKCCRCGKQLKENEGLFLYDNCKAEDQKYYEKHKNKETK